MFEEFRNGTVVDLICSESILCLYTLVDVSYVILMKVEPRAGSLRHNTPFTCSFGAGVEL